MSTQSFRARNSRANRGKARWLRALLALQLGAWCLCLSTRPAVGDDLDAAFSKGQWDEAAEIAYEAMLRDPGSARAKLRGAFALFQKGLPNSALMLIKRISPAEWKNLPQGEDRLLEIVSLFEKKVPLNVLPVRMEEANLEETSPYFHDEIHFARGRAAFEHKQTNVAKQELTQVTRGSRYFAESHYLLGAMAAEAHDYHTAQAEFSRIFDSTLLEQSAEFWKDISSEATTHWGQNFKVVLDESLLNSASEVGELGLLALARVAYATHDYDGAIGRYDKIPANSPHYPRAQLEKVWALLSAGRHEEAQNAAQVLARDDAHFESVEARTARALVLVDAGQTAQSREALDGFFQTYDAAKAALQTPNLPLFLQTDLAMDERLQALVRYEAGVTKELVTLAAQDQRIFPVYSFLSTELAPVTVQTKGLIAQLTSAHISRRNADLDRLAVQAHLIRAETFLEDREKLRREFSQMEASDLQQAAKQKEHDDRLVALLGQAIDEADKASNLSQLRNFPLEFRQAELLWELGTAKIIQTQTGSSKSKEAEAQAETLRRRALGVARDIALHHPEFIRHAQAMFFTGFAELELGEAESAISMLRDFVNRYPKHDHVPDAYRILADDEFDHNRFAAAEADYRKVLTFPDSPVVGYALYKLGWCAYNLKDYARALLSLEQAVLWAKNADSAHQLLTLKREARRDLVSVYAEVGNTDKAFDYFQRVAGSELLGWISELAEQLDKTGQYEKSAALYKQLISYEPTATDTLAYQTSIIRGAYKLRRWDDVRTATTVLVDKYKAQLAQPAQDGQPAFFAERVIRQACLAWHFEVAKSNYTTDTAALLKLDELYLSAFSGWDSSQEPLYQHAHLLLKTNRLDDAAAAFKEHWNRFQAKLKEPEKEEALRNLIFALEQIDDKHTQDGGEMGPAAKDILLFAGEYAKLYSAGRYSRPIAFLRTSIHFKYLQEEDGILQSQLLFDANPSDDIGKKAFHNLRVAYYQKKNWEKTYEWATELSARTSPKMQPFAADLKSVREESMFLWADNTVDNVTAAELFLKIAHDPQMKRLRESSLYNAFIRYQKADKKVEALEAAAWLEQSSPGFKSLPDIAPVRAALYEEAGDYLHAYPLLQTFLTHSGKAPAEVVQQARLNAGLIAEATGSGAAVGFFHAYLTGTPKGTESGQAEAKRALARMTDVNNHGGGRELASLPKGWESVREKATQFEKQSLPRGGDLASRIKAGGTHLQNLALKVVEVANQVDTPDFYAFEAYCTLPFLYSSYADGIVGLARGAGAEVADELGKVAAPMRDKAAELASQCLKKSDEADHDGPIYRSVLSRWGWKTDAVLAEKVDRITVLMAKHWPRLEPKPLSQTDDALVETNLKGLGGPDTWYSLGRTRWEAGEIGLARLTFVDAAAKSPDSGRLLNALGCLDAISSREKDAAATFEKAATSGSMLAWANLAYLYLRGGHLESARSALTSAAKGLVFENESELKNLIKELEKK